MTLENTRALVADLAQTFGLPDLPADDDGGYPVVIGEEMLFLYGQDVSRTDGKGEALLIVVPVAPLPAQPDYGTMAYLLRQNLFDAKTQPFQIALDAGGTLVLWGRVPVADLDGPALAGLLAVLALRSAELRAEVTGVDSTPA